MFCGTIDTLKKHIPTIISNDHGKYAGEVKDANTWIQEDILGDALYNTIQGEGFADDKLKELCEAVVARRAYLKGIPKFDLAETSSGFVVLRNENQTPASMERVKRLEASMAESLTESIEDLLKYLEQNEVYHEAWKGSPTYAIMTETYIHTLTEFRRFAPWEGTREAWIKAKPVMLNVMRLRIESVISEELSEEILTQLRNKVVSASNIVILNSLKHAFANYVVGNENEGNSYLYRIKKILFKYPDSYPVWKESPLYQEILANTVNKYDTNRPFFRAGF